MNKEQQDMAYSYLLTCARGCVDEPKLYGSLRLLDAFVLLTELAEPEGLPPVYARLRDEVNNFKHLCMQDEKAFVARLDEAIELLTEHLAAQ